jgi:DNA-binding XRE family transcriptional regulator
MLVVVKKPHIKFDINVEGRIPKNFLIKIANLFKKEYGNDDVVVNYDDDGSLFDVFKSDWYKETKNKMTPSDYIKIYRENFKLTQVELGKKLGGLSRQYISDLEKNRRGISKVTAKKLADIFNVSVKRFL